MEISRDALVRVIMAARTANNMADTIRKLAGHPDPNEADMIAGALADALNMLNGEKQRVEDDFTESRTYQWLFRSAMSDAEVADEFIRMALRNKTEQPKPHLISRVEFRNMVKKFGGYSTPEGDWK